MKYRNLGRTEISVSVVGVGTWQLGGDWGKNFEQDEVNAMLNRAKELGINLIDTSECYGDHLSESFIGSYLSQDKREDWIIATKFGHNAGKNLSEAENWQASEVAEQFERSLASLQTDYVDLLQFHSGKNEYFENDALWELLGGLVSKGQVRHLGISISGGGDVISQVEKATQVGASAIQVIYNRLDQSPEGKVFPECLKQNLGVLAREPLASGLLSGKYKPGANWAAGDVRHHRAQESTDKTLTEVEKILREKVPEGVDMAAWALAWCLKHDAVTTVIPGCKTVAQVEANAAAADLVDAGHPQEV